MAPKGVQDGLLSIRAVKRRILDRDADSCGRFGRPLGVMLGFMLGLSWHLFSWWFFDAFRTSFWIPTWSEIEAKIEPKTFPKTSKCRTWKPMPKVIENKLNFDRKIIDFLIWYLMIFQCVACRVFALVGMIGCLKNIQKTQGFGTLFENRPFCLNIRLSSKFDRRWSWNKACS